MASRIEGAKNALSSMLFYYIYALKESGCEDPKQTASEEIGKMIGLADEQTQFVIEDAKHSYKLSENMGLAIELLNNMEKAKKYDAETVGIVKNVIAAFKESLQSVTETGGDEDGTDKK